MLQSGFSVWSPEELQVQQPWVPPYDTGTPTTVRFAAGDCARASQQGAPLPVLPPPPAVRGLCPRAAPVHLAGAAGPSESYFLLVPARRTQARSVRAFGEQLRPLSARVSGVRVAAQCRLQAEGAGAGRCYGNAQGKRAWASGSLGSPWAQPLGAHFLLSCIWGGPWRTGSSNISRPLRACELF